MGGKCTRDEIQSKSNKVNIKKQSKLLKKIKRFKPLTVAELNTVLKLSESEKTKYMIAYNNALTYISGISEDI